MMMRMSDQVGRFGATVKTTGALSSEMELSGLFGESPRHKSRRGSSRDPAPPGGCAKM